MYRPRRLLLLQVGQIAVLFLLLYRHFPLLSHRSLSRLSASTLNMAFPSRTIGPASFALLPVLHQPLVVGPGFSPVPAKVVSQIVAGKFVELHELLPLNIVSSEPEPQLLFHGRLVLTSPPKKPKRRIDDIGTWLGAFSIFCLILVSHFPHRWKDLLQYQLLILRTYRQFSGRVWLSYDRAFRENAAATNLTDWSQFNSTLFSFHSAGWSARSSRDFSDRQKESHGAVSSQIICKSWSQCHCVAPQHPAVLPTSVLAAMASTGLQSAWPTHPAQLVFKAFSQFTAS